MASSSSSSAMNKIERAHQMYREGRHEEAVGLYSESLSVAKTKSQKIALHSNRAACFLKLHSFNEAAEECSAVLELDHNHTGALMLRAQTLVTLKEYQSALFDVNRLIEMNPSSEVYQNLHNRLKTQLSLAPIPESEIEVEEDEEKYGAELETQQVADEERNTVAAQHQAFKGWQTIPKPKGHSNLDYSRWDQVDDDSNDDDDDEEEDDSETTQPQFKFRVRTIGVRPVK